MKAAYLAFAVVSLAAAAGAEQFIVGGNASGYKGPFTTC